MSISNSIESIKSVTIYTDGACLGNPGAGGYAAILEYKETQKEISGGFKNTTHRRMELMAIIEGLNVLNQRCKVTIRTDSEFLVNVMNEGLVKKWKRNNWKLPDNTRVEDVDLWDKLFKLCEKNIVKFECIKRNSDSKQNIYCDEMALKAASKVPLLEDYGYHRTSISEGKIVKTVKNKITSTEICPICSGSGYVMVKAGPRSHKATTKVMCSQCIGTGRFGK